MLFREVAFEWLYQKSDKGSKSLSRDEIGDFTAETGSSTSLIQQQGIWVPKGFSGAVSVTTTVPSGRQGRLSYEDVLTDGYVQYSFQATNEKHNDGLRRANEYSIPLIYFRGIAVGHYDAYFPVYVDEIREVDRKALLDLSGGAQTMGRVDFGFQETTVSVGPRYGEQLVRTRLHQRAFRSTVMLAYESRCAICALGHGRLLDAAHILRDSHGGSSEVRNGLALCKIHHSAYDANILGVDPNYQIHIRSDILQEVDGPMLRHGLQERDGEVLRVVPKAGNLRPDKEGLAARFEEFTTAD